MILIDLREKKKPDVLFYMDPHTLSCTRDVLGYMRAYACMCTHIKHKITCYTQNALYAYAHAVGYN